MEVWWLLLPTGAASWGLTGWLRRYALTKNLIDIPNERSSHTAPTPRGGGLGIVAAFLAALTVLSLTGILPPSLLPALGGSGFAVALTGFMDDHAHIAAGRRLIAHFVAAVWGLYWLGGFPTLIVFGIDLDLGWFGNLGAVLYLVWLLNLYNFMDGIDGIAGIEAVTVCCGGALAAWLAATNPIAWILPIVLAAAALGFLFWNFPPAKIFMGDAGSGFLGIMLALLSIQAAWLDSRLFWAWLILLGVFIVDATLTLCRRVLRGEKFYQAHRSHAYQYASRLVESHRTVTLSATAINVVWLIPVAVLVALGKIEGVVGIAVAYLPLILLAYRYKAGDSAAQTV